MAAPDSAFVGHALVPDTASLSIEDDVSQGDAQRLSNEQQRSATTTPTAGIHSDAPSLSDFSRMSSSLTNGGPPGKRKKRVMVDESIFQSQRLKQDVLRMIAQYLQSEGYNTSATILQDESQVQLVAEHSKVSLSQKLQSAIERGKWADAAALTKQIFTNASVQRNFLFGLFKQEYLERLELKEYQKAFNHLTKRLKPLENMTTTKEMMALAYALTCKSVQDVPAFRDWDVDSGRKQLIQNVDSLIDASQLPTDITLPPPKRLMRLLSQAISYQIEFSRCNPNLLPKINTLFTDVTSFAVPNKEFHTCSGHTKNVKSVVFIGNEGSLVASASSDCDVRVWNSESGECERVLKGHTARVWSVDADRSGEYLCSGSADSTIKLWNLRVEDETAKSTIQTNAADIYSVSLHPDGGHVVSGGYDCVVRLHDLLTSAQLRELSGHKLPVSTAIFNGNGNLIITGSKDSCVKLWDIRSGVCVKSFSGSWAEVTSLDINPSGNKLLVASRGNANALFDLRLGSVLRRFHGVQNTSKNFIRTRFGCNPDTVIGGSEDGRVYIWETESGKVVQALEGHGGAVFDCQWSSAQSMIASCSDDCTVRTWTQQS